MQMYSDIIFSANDAWGKYVYSFRINMKAHELSIEYQNNQGGYTTNGINITDKKYRQINNICAKATKFFESPQFEKDVFPLDPNTWELKMIKSDGLPSLELEYGVTDDFIVPGFVVELVSLIMDLASFDNKGFRYF